MNDVAWALNTARKVGPIPPPHAHAHPIHKAHLTHTGPLRSHVAGRTDHLPSQVPNGSFVLPADIVSALGEGNTEAGYKAVKHMFGSAKRNFDGLPYAGDNGPYGQSGGPYGMADGGAIPSDRFSRHETLLNSHGYHRSSRSMQGEQETRHYSSNERPGLRYIVEHTGEWEQRRPNRADEPNGSSSAAAFGKTAKSLSSHLGRPEGFAEGGSIGNLAGRSREELERMDTDTLDRAAWGHAQGDKVHLNPKHIKIKYRDDLENPEDKFRKGGMNWAKSVDFSQPASVSIDRQGQYNLEDGHHRWYAASKLGRPLPSEITKIEGNSVNKILGSSGQPMADGGNAQADDQSVPVAVAGGEHVLAPHEVEFAGMGDNEAGHKALTEFVLRQRAKLIKDLRGLAPPKND